MKGSVLTVLLIPSQIQVCSVNARSLLTKIHFYLPVKQFSSCKASVLPQTRIAFLLALMKFLKIWILFEKFIGKLRQASVTAFGIYAKIVVVILCTFS
jgi:hypothetical protein